MKDQWLNKEDKKKWEKTKKKITKILKRIRASSSPSSNV